MFGQPRADFPSTRWSIILAAGDAGPVESRAALDSLCRTYWLPVYAFVRRRTRNVEDARDRGDVKERAEALDLLKRLVGGN